jgi:hypothetical protein
MSLNNYSEKILLSKIDKKNCLMKTAFNLLIIFFISLLLNKNISAATVTITSNINWSAITTGTGTGGIPSAVDDISIQNGVTVTVNINNAVCSSITVGGGNNNTTSILKFNASSQLTVSGAITIGSNGNRKGSIDMASGGLLKTGGAFTTPNITAFTVGTGTFEYNSASAQTILTSVNYNNLIISNNGSKSTSSLLTVNGNLTINNSAILSPSSDVTITGNLAVDGSYSQSSGITTFTGGTHSISGSGPIQIRDFVTSNEIINAGSSDIRIAGNWTHTTSGIFNSQTSTVTLNGNGSKSQPSTTFVPDFYNLIINNGAAGQLTSRIWIVKNNFELQSSTFTPLANSSIKNLTISGGTFNCPSAMTISGDMLINSTFIHNGGLINLTGTTNQTIGGSSAITFSNLTLSNSSGVTLNSTPIINGTLNLMSGIISTGINKIIIANGGIVSRTSGHINGTLQKYIPSGTLISQTFEIGGGSVDLFTPISLTFNSVSLGGNIQASTTPGDHILSGSAFNATTTVNRFWTLINPATGGIAFNSFNAIFNYQSSEQDAGINPLTFFAGKYNSGSWSYPVYSNRTVNSLSVTNETSFGEYEIGDCVLPVLSQQSLTNVACNGGSDGMISLSAITNGLPVQYQWSGGVSSGTTVTGLQKGNYTVIAIAYGGCSTQQNFAISEPYPLSADLTGGKDVCISNTTCDLLVNFSGGTLPWTFIYNDGTDHTITANTNPYKLTVSPLTTTTYLMKAVSDYNNCQGTVNNQSTQVKVNDISNGGLISTITSICSGSDGMLNLNGHTGNILKWQSSEDNFQTYTDLPNTSSTQGFSALNHSTSYRAVVQNTGCEITYSPEVLITVNQPTTSSSNISVCSNNLPFTWNGKNILTTGHYETYLTNSNGCDSTAGLNLNISNITSSFSSVIECDNYKWNNNIYNESGIYSGTFQNSNGCDSVASLELTINKSTESAQNIISCDEYTWNGMTYSSSGTYTKHFINATGCDSTATLNLTINSKSNSLTQVTECDSYNWNGNTYNSSGQYVIHLTNEYGCDLTATLDLTILKSSESLSPVTECDHYMWNGIDYDKSGTYSKHFTNSAGCDSTAILNLVISESTSSIQTIEECDMYGWNGIDYVSSGTYMEHFANSQGCDSTATLVLILKKSSESEASVTECDKFSWNGNEYKETGIYTYHLINSVGCDSTATLNLTINNRTISNTIVKECNSYTWNGNLYSTSGHYEATFLNSNGCDSTAMLDLSILNSTSSASNVTECESYKWNNEIFPVSGIYSKHFINAAGCDSVATLNLTIKNSSQSRTDVTDCESYTWNGNTYKNSGVYENHFVNVQGCDSTAILDLKINHGTSSMTGVTECNSYTWNGVTYTQSGFYQSHLINSAGCDSLATIELNIVPSTVSEINVTECDQYTWNNHLYELSGTYVEHFINLFGCDSTATLNLIINKGSSSSFNAVTCDEYMLPWNQAVQSSGDYSYTYQNASGCDSVVTAHITINNTPSSPVVTVTNSCNGSVCTVINPSGNLIWSTGSTQSSITVFSAGTYKVKQIIAGCISTAGTVVVPSMVYGKPVLPNNINGPEGACKGQNGIVFSIPSVPGAVSYNWTLSNGMSGTSSMPSITISMANNFNGGNICINAVNACGTSNTVCKSLVRIKQLPPDISAVSGPASICPASTATYSVPANATSTSFTWTASTGLTIISGQGTNTIVVKTDPQFNIGKIKVKANNCVGSSSSLTKTVTGMPSLPIWKVIPAMTACSGSCYAFNIDNVHDASSWTFSAPAGCIITCPDGKTGNPVTTSVSYALICFPAGFISGNIVVYSNNGCGQSAPLIYPVRSKPSAPSEIAGQKTNLCGAMGVVYSVSPAEGATSYSWSIPYNTTIVESGNNSITLNYLPGFTKGDICVRAKNQCGYSAQVCISVTSVPETPVSVAGPLTVCKTQKNVQYTVSPVPGATNYAWSINGGAIVTGTNGNPTVTIKFKSVIAPVCTLSVKAKNSCGLSVSKKIYITVKNDCRLEEEEDATLLVDKLTAYPNPAHDKTQIKFESLKEGAFDFMLMDVLGNVLMKQPINITVGINIKDIDVSKYAHGLYYAVIQSENEERFTYTLVVE